VRAGYFKNEKKDVPALVTKEPQLYWDT